MHNTQIGIFKIAQTRVDWEQIIEWLKFLGVKNPEKVQHQLSTGTDASQLIALCGKRCYASFDTESGLNPNVTKIREDHTTYIANVLASGHGSVTEHATWSFAIENVSRVFTGELNRHRAGVAISEASMRYIRFDDIGFTIPGSIEETDEDRLKMLEDDQNSWVGETEYGQKAATRAIFEQAFETTEQYYLDLCNIWKIEEMTDFNRKKQLTSMFRRIVGMGVSTGGVWTMNARALNWILGLRSSSHAEEEICEVFCRIAEIMIRDEPLLFGHFKKNEKGFWESGHPKV